MKTALQSVSITLSLILGLLLFSPQISANNPIQNNNVADWTILIFMNGDNNLSDSAIDDFLELNKVNINKDINVIVQIDRIGENVDESSWGQTLRFKVQKNTSPSPKYALEDIGEANMGNGQVLSDFVKWGKTNYPSKHTMLIIWDHGQGWRLFNKRKELYSLNDRSAKFTSYKSVSHDITDNDELYNREIQDSLTLSLKGEKLDIIGFDACLMAMIETAYAFRDIANIMIASQELEPGTGWQYDDWLSKLANNPKMTPFELSKIVVESYKKISVDDPYNVGTNPSATLSAVDLTNISKPINDINILSEILLNKINTNGNEIIKARNKCNTYAPKATEPFYHIDLIQFCKMLHESSKDRQIKDQATRVIESTQSIVKSNFAGKARKGKFGSYGLCIYFPPSKKAYNEDVLAENGYEKDNLLFPVEFVQNIKWSDFLHKYLDFVENK